MGGEGVGEGGGEGGELAVFVDLEGGRFRGGFWDWVVWWEWGGLGGMGWWLGLGRLWGVLEGFEAAEWVDEGFGGLGAIFGAAGAR